MNKPKIYAINRTCEACPSQWELTTDEDDGYRYVYVRYRWGHFTAGIADSEEEYWKNRDWESRSNLADMRVGDKLDGCIDEKKMMELLKDKLDFGDFIDE